ncbi:MAG: DUF1559 domain-containing protein [Pirellulaceae bacterium]
MSGLSTGRHVRGMTLVELLVVISILSMLAAVLIPAVNSARESGRQMVCQTNLRQIGIGLMSNAEHSNGLLCSGAFDWRHDGSVTDVGWVADLVTSGAPVGQMLCPSNPAQVSEAYIDLLSATFPAEDPCVNRLGSPPTVAPDGQPIVNPCRQIIAGNLSPGSLERQVLVTTQIFDKTLNTNYTASWYLVRTGPRLKADGNLGTVGTCEASMMSRTSTLGPLRLALVDGQSVPAAFIPLMGCGATGSPLPYDVGDHVQGELTTRTFSKGPVLTSTLTVPTFPGSTRREGPSGWWGVWARTTLQDFRSFAPVHRHSVNLLFADGSVRSLPDINKDGLLNNGFPVGSGGFQDTTVDLPPDAVFSGYSVADLPPQ